MVVHNSEDHKEKDKSKVEETRNEDEEVKITRNQKKIDDNQEIQIQNLEKGVCVLNPDDLEEMKEEVAEKGTSDITVPTLQEAVNDRKLWKFSKMIPYERYERGQTNKKKATIEEWTAKTSQIIQVYL